MVISLLATTWLALCSPAAHAQNGLGAADLKRVQALSGNTFAWAVLRKAVAMALADAGADAVAGQQDSVDTIAAVIALEEPDGRLSPVLAGAARGGLMGASRPDLVGAIGLDGGRAKAVGCLVFGQSPAERILLADLIELSERERAACAEHVERIRQHWLAAATPIRLGLSEPESQIELLYEPAPGSLASARSVIIAGQTVDEIGLFLQRFIRFSRPIRMVGKACGVPRVDFDMTSGQLTFCYELFLELVDSIGQSVGGG